MGAEEDCFKIIKPGCIRINKPQKFTIRDPKKEGNMPKFGKRSTREKLTCHQELQDILDIAIKHVDFSILEGFRDKKTQNMYFEQGKSKLTFPKGKHNKTPSMAVDIAPWPINWKDINRFRSLVFFVKGIAYSKGIELRLGIDWNGDFKANESFIDAPHIELHKKLINGKWLRYE